VRAALLLALALSACGGGAVVQGRGELPPAPPDEGFVRIHCDPAEADIYVDGAFHGRLDGYPEGVLRLPRGTHRLELRQRGHYSYYADIDAGPAPVEIETHLVPEPPADP
jgi:hypothetical protein